MSMWTSFDGAVQGWMLAHQDPRLVRIMERHGFSWGGRWPTVPDGMHFEYHGDGPVAADEPF